MNNIQFDQKLHNKLTPREIEIARLAKEGKNCREIGATMRISASTVGSFRSRIMNKTGAKNMIEAVATLKDAGIL